MRGLTAAAPKPGEKVTGFPVDGKVVAQWSVLRAQRKKGALGESRLATTKTKPILVLKNLATVGSALGLIFFSCVSTVMKPGRKGIRPTRSKRTGRLSTQIPGAHGRWGEVFRFFCREKSPHPSTQADWPENNRKNMGT